MHINSYPMRHHIHNLRKHNFSSCHALHLLTHLNEKDEIRNWQIQVWCMRLCSCKPYMGIFTSIRMSWNLLTANSLISACPRVTWPWTPSRPWTFSNNQAANDISASATISQLKQPNIQSMIKSETFKVWDTSQFEHPLNKLTRWQWPQRPNYWQVRREGPHPLRLEELPVLVQHLHRQLQRPRLYYR